MKRSILFGIAALTITSSLVSAQSLPLYRLRSNKGEHLYTTSTAERDRAISADGYRLEGVICYLWTKQATGTDPLYRLYKGSNGTPDHFYTADPAEKQKAETRDGYKVEGVTGYIAKTQLPGTVPLYRLFSVHGGEHFYTVDEKERQFAETHDGFKDEGIAGYVMPPGAGK